MQIPTTDERWLLPGGMDEMLPQQALQREALRRRIFDAHLACGYLPVHPPFVEYIESLLTAAGQDFDRQTFRLADPHSGRMLGVRADMTPQVARIDAHQMRDVDINRLFYMGTVVRAHGGGPEGSRSPFQLGAELFGHQGTAGDIEIIQLMLSTLSLAGVDHATLDLGHVGVFRRVCARLELTPSDESILFGLLQAKAETDIRELCRSLGIEQGTCDTLLALCALHGDKSVLDRAAALLVPQDSEVEAALAELGAVGDAIQAIIGEDRVHYDLAELRGYQYHTGIVFAAYVEHAGREIARGGRYDDIGAAFGRARSATGYSTDLKALMRLSASDLPATGSAILAPCDPDPQLQQTIRQLRLEGQTVINDIAATGSHQRCDRVLRKSADRWIVESV